MKIVDRKTFLKMPKGTLFQRYVPMCTNGPLEILMETSGSGTCGNYSIMSLDGVSALDFSSTEEMVTVLDDMKSNKTSRNIDIKGSFTWDSCFDDKELYLVWEINDMIALRDRLSESIAMIGGKV